MWHEGKLAHKAYGMDRRSEMGEADMKKMEYGEGYDVEKDMTWREI